MIFNKNKTSPLISVIKNNGSVDYLVWKNPVEDFTTRSQLIVSESEEALFCYEGVIQEIYTAGRYELTTANTPFIGKIRNSYSNGVSMFNAKVFFVNLSHALELKWGTDTPLQMRDSEFNFSVGVRAFGTYSIKVTNSKKLILKLLGSNIKNFEKEDIKQYFKTVFVMNIKNYLHKKMKDMKITVLDMGTYLVDIADDMLRIMKPTFEEYGLELVHFYIKDISIPQDDPHYQQINDAYARKAALRIQGQDYERQVAAEAIINASKNPGNIGTNFGMGVAMGKFFGDMVPKMMKTNDISVSQEKQTCPQCGMSNESGMKFCSHCGNSLATKKIACINCGFQLQENNKFCPNCGKLTQHEKVCPNCQIKNSFESKFCGSCGTKLD